MLLAKPPGVHCSQTWRYFTNEERCADKYVKLYCSNCFSAQTRTTCAMRWWVVSRHVYVPVCATVDGITLPVTSLFPETGEQEMYSTVVLSLLTAAEVIRREVVRYRSVRASACEGYILSSLN